MLGGGDAPQPPLGEQCSGHRVYRLNGGKAGCPDLLEGSTVWEQGLEADLLSFF